MKLKSPYDLFGTDQNLEKDGIVIDYGDFSLKIARSGGGNVNYKRLAAAKLKPYAHQLQTGTLDDDRARDLMLEIFVDSVLLDWKGVVDEKGKAIKYTRENAIKLFKDLPDLYADITEQANKTSNFRREIVEETIKN